MIILFKAKTLRGKEVEGYHWEHENEHYIRYDNGINMTDSRIDPETLVVHISATTKEKNQKMKFYQPW